MKKDTKRKIAFMMVCVLMVMIFDAHIFAWAAFHEDSGMQRGNLPVMAAVAATPTASASVTPAVTPTASASVTPAVTPTASASVTPAVTPTASATVPPAKIPTDPAVEIPSPEPSGEPVSVKKTVTITLGKTIPVSRIVSDPEQVEKITVSNAKKYYKYFRINSKTKKIKTYKNYSVKIKKKIRIKVKLQGVEEVSSVLVKIKIPKPKVKITVKAYGGKRGYDFSFHYQLPNKSRLKVRLVKGGTKAMNRYFDKYISGRKSKKSSHIKIIRKSLKKYKNKLSFKITAYYGKGQNKSQTLKITKKVK